MRVCYHQRKHQNDSQKSVRNDCCTCSLEANFSLQNPSSHWNFLGLWAPTPPEFPIPSVVGVWIFSKTHNMGFTSLYSFCIICALIVIC